MATFAAVAGPSPHASVHLHEVPHTALQTAAAAQLRGGEVQRAAVVDKRSGWRPGSWRACEARQLPVYEDQAELSDVLAQLAREEPLVAQRDVLQLRCALAEAASGNSFLLMGGDCAETFKEFSTERVRETYNLLQQMGLAISYGSEKPVVTVGRIAGQFAKPRSDADEERNGVCLPSYRGDIINGESFSAEARRPQPSRMLRVYRQSMQTLQQLQQIELGEASDARASELHQRNQNFARRAQEGSAARSLLPRIEQGDFSSTKLASATLYTSHECLLLPYEEQFTKQCHESGEWFDRSAHMLWIGERTRQLNGAHMEFAKGISNPIGVKVSEKCSAEELVQLIRMLNPHNILGRISIITRMGADGIYSHLPVLVRAVQASRLHVLWVCDPMHGNTFKTDSGVKTRHTESIRAEIKAFFDVHRELGSHAGGVHLELTSGDVTECVGGEIDVEHLEHRYHTACDPRLNHDQSLEIAFFIASMLSIR